MSVRRCSLDRSLRTVLTVVALTVCGLYGPLAWSAEPSATTQPARVATRPASVPLFELRGDPAEIGKAHGTQLAEPIQTLVRDYFGRFMKAEAKGLDRDLARAGAMAFTPFVNRAHLAEIQALAKAAGIDPRDAMLGQCFTDIALVGGCSTITLPAAASADGVARFGRNLDFLSLNLLDRNTVILVFHPKDAYAFASICYPGMVGVLSGMNEHGLTLANMEVHRRGRMPSGMPYMLLYRTLLERCRTVQEALTLLEKTPRQSANNLMLMDASGDRAVAEITPEAVKVRRAPDTAALISTNHQRGEDLDKAGRCRRFDYLHTAAEQQFGKVTEEAVEEMLAGAAQNKATIQSMVFEPANRVLYLAVGAGAHQYKYVRVELKSYLQGSAAGKRDTVLRPAE
jgi:isopenicillin-N N-acyltransferase like protein